MGGRCQNQRTFNNQQGREDAGGGDGRQWRGGGGEGNDD